MGQAKARGTYDVRRVTAIEVANQASQERELAEQLEARKREAERNTLARIYSPVGRSANNRSVLALSALALTASYKPKL